MASIYHVIMAFYLFLPKIYMCVCVCMCVDVVQGGINLKNIIIMIVIIINAVASNLTRSLA